MLNPAQVQAARAKLGVTPVASPTTPSRSAEFQKLIGTTDSSAAGYLERVGNDISGAAKEIGGSLAPKPVDLKTELSAGAHIAKEATGAALAPIAEIPGMKQVGEFLGGAGKAVLDAVDPQIAKSFTDFLHQHPTISDALSTAMNVGALSGGVKVGIEGVAKAPAAYDAITNALSKTAKEGTVAAPEASTGALDSIRAWMGKESADPRLEASAGRLKDPVKLYGDYATQAKSAVTDVKAEPPISTVGENIGNAYDKVASMRRLVGNNMGEELAKVKDTPVDVVETANKIKTDLFEPNSITLKPEIADKMTTFDREQLGHYYAELTKLGKTPTAAQVDSFLSRIPRELDVTKAAKNITDTTNAERIIKTNLSDLRDSLGKQPGFGPYVAARKAYANLSNFLDEGSRYLGAKTQTGDYARDASVAKSSAESILAGGKKDWLVKLEDLTGYKALDDATVAIQAMADAGDNRGLSLFKSLGDTAFHPSTLSAKLFDFAMNAGKKAVGGSAADQTKAFLESLKTEAPQIAPK